MIEVFKLVNDMYYFNCTNLFTFRDQSKRVTWGNKKKLFKYRARLDERCFRPLLCTVKAELGRGQPGLMRWIWDETLPQSRLDVRKYSFTNRVVDLWNSLPDSVISAETVFSLETRLDDYWKDQDILYEYESKIKFKLQGNSQDQELVL